MASPPRPPVARFARAFGMPSSSGRISYGDPPWLGSLGPSVCLHSGRISYDGPGVPAPQTPCGSLRSGPTVDGCCRLHFWYFVKILNKATRAVS
jgi:hypothetical protein